MLTHLNQETKNALIGVKRKLKSSESSKSNFLGIFESDKFAECEKLEADLTKAGDMSYTEIQKEVVACEDGVRARDKAATESTLETAETYADTFGNLKDSLLGGGSGGIETDAGTISYGSTESKSGFPTWAIITLAAVVLLVVAYVVMKAKKKG